MTLLVENYEQERYPIPPAEPVDVLRFLLEQNGLSQRDIAPELGSESTVSLVLSGKRQLNRDHIARLSRRFKVSAAVFFGASSSYWSASLENCKGSYRMEVNQYDIVPQLVADKILANAKRPVKEEEE